MVYNGALIGTSRDLCGASEAFVGVLIAAPLDFGAYATGALGAYCLFNSSYLPFNGATSGALGASFTFSVAFSRYLSTYWLALDASVSLLSLS